MPKTTLPAFRNRLWDFGFSGMALAVVVVQVALHLPPITGIHQYFCVYHAGVDSAWHGNSPYHIGPIQNTVERRLKIQPGGFSCGFFLPPTSFVILAPFATVSWQIADRAWILLSISCAVICGSLAHSFGRTLSNRPGWGFVAATILLCPLVQRAIALGQTPLFICACIALAQRAFECGRPRLGTLLWASVAIKPHLALPLLAAAWFIGGWRRGMGIAVTMSIAWIAGCFLIGDPVSVSLGYVDFLGDSHKAIGFNRIENDQIVGWNRLLASVGGPLIEFGSIGVLAGFSISLGVLWALRIRRLESPNSQWILAASVAWGLFTAQAHGYELVMLALTAPYLLRLKDQRCHVDLAVLLGVLLVMSVPREAVVRLMLATDVTAAILSYRAAALAVFCVHLLIRKPQ